MKRRMQSDLVRKIGSRLKIETCARLTHSYRLQIDVEGTLSYKTHTYSTLSSVQNFILYKQTYKMLAKDLLERFGT